MSSAEEEAGSTDLEESMVVSGVLERSADFVWNVEGQHPNTQPSLNKLYWRAENEEVEVDWVYHGYFMAY